MGKFVCVAHHGYLIRKHYIDERWWIEKGGKLICWCKDEDDGKRTINELLAPQGVSRQAD